MQTVRGFGTKSRLARIGQIAVALPFAALLLPLVVMIVAGYFLYGLMLQFLIWSLWCRRGTRVMLVGSDIPVWHDYLDQEVLPRLPASTIVLNWSHRRRWRRWSLAVLAFRYFARDRECVPVAVIFRPFRWATTIRFYKSFRDFKHGSTRNLHEAVHELLQSV